MQINPIVKFKFKQQVRTDPYPIRIQIILKLEGPTDVVLLCSRSHTHSVNVHI